MGRRWSPACTTARGASVSRLCAEHVVDWGDPRVRRAFRERVDGWRERTARALKRAEVDLMDVPVLREPDRDAVVRPILQFFRMREQRGTKR